MRYPIKESTVAIPGGETRYIAFGGGSKPLVLIQGLSTRGIQGMALPLAWMYRTFAKAYRVYCFDRRNEIPKEITVRELADDVAAAMDAMGISDADVLGVSQGGMIAQELAIQRPDLVHKLVLAVTLCQNNEKVVATVNHWVELAEPNKTRQLVGEILTKMYSERYQKRYRPFLPLLAFLQQPKDPQRFISLAKACLTCHTYERLSQIQCPVLVIGGRKDRVLGGEASMELAQKLGCELFLYDDLGHAVYEEASDFNRRVFDFFQKPPAPAPARETSAPEP